MWEAHSVSRHLLSAFECLRHSLTFVPLDICVDRQPDETLEFLRIPLSDKFGNFDDNCYANVEISFSGCDYDQAAGQTNNRNTVATVKSKDAQERISTS